MDCEHRSRALGASGPSPYSLLTRINWAVPAVRKGLRIVGVGCLRTILALQTAAAHLVFAALLEKCSCNSARIIRFDDEGMGYEAGKEMPIATAVRRAVLVGAAWHAGAACTKGADLKQGGALGAIAPEFTAQTLDDRTVSLDSLRGKVVLLNLWATWCGPCKEEIPEIEALHRAFATTDLRVIGVSIDAAGSGLDIRDFMQANNMTYEIWLDPTNEFALKFLTIGVPQTILLDRNGVVRWRMIGALKRGDSTLSAAVRTALGS